LGEHEGKEIHLEDMGKPHHNSNKVKIPNILNTDLAEILGFYMGDGCWSNGRLILSFSKTEEHLLDYMIKKIKSVFNLKPSEKRSRGNYIDVVWSSKELERYFSKRIWKKNSSTDSFIPADIMMSKKEVLAAFIRGLFEADGYVNNWGHPVLYTTSKSLVSQLQTALLSLGILSTATISKAKNICGHLGSNDVYQIRITDEESIYRFSRLIGFISNEKNLKLKKALNKKFEYIRKIPNVSNILKEIHLEIKKKDKKRAYRFYRKTRKYIYNHRNLTYFRLKRLADEFEELKPLLEKYKRYVFTKITNIKTSRNIVFHLETSSGRYIANGFLVHNKRRGANMGILEIWHPDIEKFITSKSTQGMLENFNISVMITPDFWEKYYNNENYVLKNPRDDRPWKEVNARQLFRLIAENAWKTGDPGVLFLDNINKRNILRKGFGEIKSTNPCVTGDTLVYTPRGIYEIREIVNGVTEICVDDRAILKYQIGKPVGLYRAEGDVVKTGVRPIIKIETEHGLVLKVTPDHKVRIAENLGRTSDGNAYRFRLKWKEAGKLRNGDTLILNSINIWDDWEEEIDGIPLTWKLGYIIGYIMGDGYVNEDSVNMYFDMKKEKDLAEKMRIMIKETLGIDPYIDIKGNKLWLKIHSKKIVNIFRKLGVSIGKSNKREIPRIVFRSPRRFVIGFVTGLWEANGTINISKGKNANIRISSSSQNLLKGLQHILLALGIPSRLYLCRRRYGELSKHTIKNGYKSLYTTREDHILVISKDNIIKMISILDPQGNYKKYKLRELSRINSKRGFYKEYYLSKVVNIENGDIEEVYDILNIPGHHAFVANGIIIHNCGEEPLYPYESCNLGSINLYAFVEYDEEGNRYFNWEEYKRVIKTATRFLDNVIDVNKYPIPKIAEMSRKTRKIGLGLMGLADTLYALKIPYNSEDGFKLMKKFAEHLTYYSMETSIERAIERGTFPAYDLSSYPDGEMPIEGYYDRKEWTLDWNRLHERIRHYGIRNAETTTIAPTGSISMIADTSSGIEPQFALVFEKRVSVGTFFYVDPELERTLHSMGLYNEHILKAIADNGGSLQELEGIPKELKKIFLVAYDIPWWDHVRAQAEISKWICAAVSKTINMPNWVTVDDVEKAFIYAYKIGNKGITIYRDGSKTKQVLVTPSQRKGSYVLNIGNNTLKMMKKMGIEPPIPTKAETKLADRTMKIMMRQTKEGLGDGSKDTAKEYEVCPECGGTNIIYVEACLKCLECGWSLCVTS
jgi:ribonucleoside-diphosphate reductase alpha chain